MSGAGAVIIVPPKEAGNCPSILLVKITKTQKWNIPGGFLKKWEPPLKACVRETLEETHESMDLRQLTPLHEWQVNDFKYFFYVVPYAWAKLAIDNFTFTQGWNGQGGNGHPPQGWKETDAMQLVGIHTVGKMGDKLLNMGLYNNNQGMLEIIESLCPKIKATLTVIVDR